MSVLPSFKSAFSSLADAEASHDVRAVDDSGIPTYAATTSIAPHSTYQDRRSPSAWPTRRSTPPRPTTSTLPSSRPAVSLLPLNLLTSDLTDDTVFGFARLAPNRPTNSPQPASLSRSHVAPLPLDSLAPSDSVAYIPPRHVRNTSSTVHCPTYKRRRTQSVSARGSYVKHSCSSSDRRSRPPPQISTAHSNSTHTPPQNSNPLPTTSNHPPPPSSTPHPSLSHSTPQLPTSHTPVSLPSTIPPTPSLTHHPTIPPLTSVARPSVPSSLPSHSIRPSIPIRTAKKEPETHPASLSNPLQPGPSSSALLRAVVPKSSPLVVTFAPPTLSHRSAASEPISNQEPSSILNPVRIIEDSTSRAPVDVLSSPRARSLNSAITAKTCHIPNNTAPIISLSRGPTASDFSHLFAHSRPQPNHHSDNLSDLVDGTDAIKRDNSNNAINALADNNRHVNTPTVAVTDALPVAMQMDTRNTMQQHRIAIPREDNHARRHMPGATTHMGTSSRAIVNAETTGRNVDDGDGGNGYRIVGHESKMPTGLRDVQVTVTHADPSPQEPWRQNPRPTPQGTTVPVTSTQMRPYGHVNGSSAVGMSMEAGMNGRREMMHRSEDNELDGITGNDDSGSVQCPTCPRKLRNQVTLQNHIRVVHDHSGNFRCAQCGLTFMWKSTLGNHVRLVHEKQRPYPCPECGKAFRWKSHLREHCWVVHKGEKPFKCEKCGKTFGRKNNMQKHMRKHSEVVT